MLKKVLWEFFMLQGPFCRLQILLVQVQSLEEQHSSTGPIQMALPFSPLPPS